jgi:ssDNA-binding Zn-finger/Zn-ribbon topoisomerase 1
MTTPDDPQSYFKVGDNGRDRYSNPFYNIPLQYLPMNIEGMLLWAEHFLFRNGFYKQALNRIANYFITSLTIECDDEEAKKTYQETLDNLKWKQVCAKAGLNLLAYGNEFVTVNQGFHRYLTCPNCNKTSNIDKLQNYEFNKGKYVMGCLKCSYRGEHKCVDKPANDIDKIHIVHWPAKEIKIRHEETTGESEYFWDIPQQYAKKVITKNNKFYSKKTPQVVFECVFNKTMLAFNNKNFVHLKLDTPSTIRTDGKAIPPSMFIFEDLFMLQTLKRYNEVICFEDIAPFRVISMGDSTNPAANPLLNQNGAVWSNAVDNMIDEHRRDPGSYHKFAFPLNYQQLGGEGTKLAPVEMMENARNAILNALDIPVEMFQMTFQQQAAGPMLRMFENAWSVIPSNYNSLLTHMGEVIGNILGLPKAKISLIPITFSDDIERKGVISQLVSANAIARSELLKMYNFDYSDQIRKKMEEDRIAQDLQREEQERQQIADSTNQSLMQLLQGQQQGGGSPQAGGPGGTVTPQDALQQAQEIAQQLFPQDGSQRRAQLQQIKAQDQELYAQVKAQLEQMTSQSKSQGLQGAKQQAAGGQQ